MRNVESKDKLLSFRLSRREYDQAVETSKTQGYRSVALFARSAVLALCDKRQTTLEVQVTMLARRVERLESEIAAHPLMVGLGQPSERAASTHVGDPARPENK